ncbi:hypothetical protein ACTXNA_11195, partial [Psychrobacter celer]|uniref:hypothetical protein n=1 Tax=Psychrobacter celer TaxID=306572 RepID=UPI003FCF0C0E
LNKVPFFLYEYHEKCTEFLIFINEDIHEINEINDNFLISNKVIYSLCEQKKLMAVECYTQKSRLNITENPLYIKG